jgi:hypothetical protein
MMINESKHALIFISLSHLNDIFHWRYDTDNRAAFLTADSPAIARATRAAYCFGGPKYCMRCERAKKQSVTGGPGFVTNRLELGTSN